MGTLKGYLTGLTICLMGLASCVYGASTQGFLRVDGLEGDSEEKFHEGWIEIMSYSYDRSYWDTKLDQPSAVDHLTGSRRGGEMLITREQSKAFPEFFEAASEGSKIPEMTIEITTDERDPDDRRRIITYTLHNVYVKMLRVDRKNRSRSASPIETMAIGFQRVSWESEVREKTPRYPTHINRWH